MNEILCHQIAIDYCCTPQDVLDHENHFTRHYFAEGRRRFREDKDCYLKLAVIGGKLLFTGDEEIIPWCRETYAGSNAEWFLEAKNLRELNDRLHQYGYQIESCHPFFISESISEVNTAGYEIRWYEKNDIEMFR